ncbi:hypothetical protein LC085_10955 [Bacillus tianshenii]|uniref:hypothetical protein n=1 Tax=Sutcliffiella tianshenii TaxID=1463404 RepID=UPI001CD42A56|nr:hypothetical protein [Bacillus tianshenii]MCA1320428.1 hypothetical protein [Bacillus tianshenii]
MNVKVIVLFLFMISLIGVTGCMNAENKFLSHLEEKYNEEFEVENVKEGSIIFSEMYGKDKALVHPKGNEELVFLAGEYRKTEEKYDNYVLAKWGEELKAELKEDMESELPNSPYKVSIMAADDTYDASMLDKPFSDYVKENKNIMIMLTIGVYTSGEPKLEEYSQGIYNMYQKLKEYGTDSYAISVGFVDESEDITDYIRTANINNIAWSNLDAKVYGDISFDERSNPENPSSSISEELIVTSPESVINHYEKLGE